MFLKFTSRRTLIGNVLESAESAYRKSHQFYNGCRICATRNLSSEKKYSFFDSLSIKPYRQPDLRTALYSFGGCTSLALLAFTFSEEHKDKKIPAAEVVTHCKPDDCWIVLNGKVYDVTLFLKAHPGGVSQILEFAGRDATDAFHDFHPDELIDRMSDSITFLGYLSGELGESSFEKEPRTVPPLGDVFSLADFERVAADLLPESVFAYYATGAADEVTVRENQYAYSRVFFRPTVLADLPYDVDTSTEFLGSKVNLPIYISAFAGSKMADPLAEKSLQYAAYDTNIMQMVPKQCSYSFEEFFEDVPQDQNHWYQYHISSKKEMEELLGSLKKFESQPSIKGLFLSVDLADIGMREKTNKQKYFSGKGRKYPSDNTEREKTYYSFTWSDIDKIMSLTNLPVALKGVQRGEDVVIAAEKGIKAVVLSNHGGRQLDFSRPPLEVLAEASPMLKEKNLQGKIEIYVDGGVRRGSDVIKAICLGATGVGLGRPFLYAMVGYGQEGVLHLIETLRYEIKNNMRLLGVSKLEELDESLIDCRRLKTGQMNSGTKFES